MTEYKRDDSAQQTTDTASVFRSINLMSVGVAALCAGCHLRVDAERRAKSRLSL